MHSQSTQIFNLPDKRAFKEALATSSAQKFDALMMKISLTKMEIFTNKQLIRYQVESTKIVPLIGAISLLVFPLHHKLMKKAR